MAVKSFDHTTLKNIAEVVSVILSHTEITQELQLAGIKESNQGTNKKDRLFYAMKDRQQQDACGNNILAFVKKVIDPRRYINNEIEFEQHRCNLNSKLLFEGIEMNKYGEFATVDKARTITEARERSQKIKQKIHGIGVHPDALKFCEVEYLQENYFHAILEITKSVADKMRQKTNYVSDGSDLVDECFALGKEKKPMLAFNLLNTPSEESEHKGFANLMKGFFSMYRNPKAHNPKINEETQLSEMMEVLVISSIIHRKLDASYVTGYK